MKLKLLILINLFSLALSLPVIASDKELGNSPIDKSIGLSATEWRQMYFYGISKKPVDQISLSEGQVSSLLSIINLASFISNGAPIEPQFMINQKGTTPWLAMYALVHVKDKEGLNLIANGKSRIHVPAQFVHSQFGDHINWPKEMLGKYDFDLGEYRVFAIPFLIHERVTQLGKFKQTLKAPDGSMEIFGVREFYENNPEGLLKEFEALVHFIKTERPDAIQ